MGKVNEDKVVVFVDVAAVVSPSFFILSFCRALSLSSPYQRHSIIDIRYSK